MLLVCLNMQKALRVLSFLILVSLKAMPATAASTDERAPVSDKPTALTRVISVGASREIRTLRKASQVARDGDIVEVDAGDYAGDTAVWTQKQLTIRGMGQRPRLLADGQAAEGKGIFVIKGGNVTLENLGFFNTRVKDRNGAGVRLDRGQLTVVNCVFENNENGILTSNDKSIELRVRNSTFSNNGAGDGYSHHLYAGTIAELEVSSSYFGPARTGHLLKSRAKMTTVLYNRLTGEDGTSSYEMDIPNGGVLKAVGNLVQQGDQTENSVLISYGAEGYRWPDNHAHIAFNTLVSDRAQAGVFIAIRSGPAEAVISNNILVGRGRVDAKTPATMKNNAEARITDFVDPSRFDYRLRTGSALVGSAGPARAVEREDRPTRQYQHPAQTVELSGITELTPLSPGAFQRLAP